SPLPGLRPAVAPGLHPAGFRAPSRQQPEQMAAWWQRPKPWPGPAWQQLEQMAAWWQRPRLWLGPAWRQQVPPEQVAEPLPMPGPIAQWPMPGPRPARQQPELISGRWPTSEAWPVLQQVPVLTAG